MKKYINKITNYIKKIGNKKVLTLFIIYIAILGLLGGTFAYLNWESNESQNTEIVFTLNGDFSCAADVGGSINPEDIPLAPSSCTNSTHAIKRELIVKPTIYTDKNVYMDLWLDINSIAEELSASENFKYALTTSDNSCTDNVIVEGTFNQKIDGDKIDLFYQKQYTETTEETYYLYIWLDAAETNVNTAGKSFDFTINGTCSDLQPEHTVTFDSNGGAIDSTLFTTVGETEYTVPSDGEYQIELWGASGGNGGSSGYTSGKITLNKNEKLYITVGGKGDVANGTGAGGYNGGGGTLANSGKRGPTGGGATDVRYLSNTLNDRIMVAGGGSGYGTTGYASAGGLIGYDGSETSYTYYVNVGKGATQTSGGATPTMFSTAVSNGTAGSFGQGGTGGASANGVENSGGAGGGGGYYGGSGASGLTNGTFGAGGGSSYISGHTGCVAITSSSSTTPKSGCTTGSTDNSCSLHYSGKSFSNTLMIDGNGYKWTTSKGSLQQMPNPNGGYYDSGVGHTGDGAAKINQLDGTKTVTNSEEYGTLPTPTRAGYTFAGWNTSSDGTGEIITSETIANLDSDQILFAIWRSSKVIIKYNVNDGTIASSTTSSSGTVYNWGTETDGNILLNDSLLTTTITYGGQTSSDGLNNYNNSSYINITKSGYSAPSGAEWVCMSGCTTANKTFDQTAVYSASDFCDVTYGDCTVVVGVNWKQTYTVSYNANGGSGAPSAQTKYHDTTLTLSSTSPTKSGYIFAGWSTSSSATSATYKAGGNYTANASVTLYAVWKTVTTTSEAYFQTNLTNDYGNNAGYVLVYYSTSYNPVTNETTVNLPYKWNNLRLSGNSYSTGSLSATITVRATDSGATATSTMSYTITNNGGYQVVGTTPNPTAVTVKHTNTIGSKAVTISCNATYRYDYGSSGSNSASVTTGTYSG